MRVLTFCTVLFIVSFSSMMSNEFLTENSNPMFGFFHNFISPLKELFSYCQLTPTCSEYAWESVKDNGLEIGRAHV